VRRWGSVLLLIILLVASVGVARASHKPLYKGSADALAPGAWEAHFVWLRSDYFTYTGEIWWEVYVDPPGHVDVLFFDLPNFEAFRDGQAPRPLLDPLVSVPDGAQRLTGLTGDLPYFLVLQNGGTTSERVTWTIYAEIDWRRWQGQPPGPDWNLTVAVSSPPLNRSDAWETTFSEPAVFVYHCLPHIDMTGIVEVVPSTESSGTVNVTISHMGFHPEVIQVPVGTTVRWTNLDNLTHSVNLAVIPGGFVLPPSSFFGPAFTVALVVAAASVVVIALLVLRRRERRPEGTSKTEESR
jgi:plastocyanin